MRISVLVFVALIASPNASSADALVKARLSDSFVIYGLWGSDFTGNGYDHLKVSRDGAAEVSQWLSVGDFDAETGPAVSKTVETEAGGTIIKTVYQYGDGSLALSFTLTNVLTGETKSGDFTAPILNATITVMELPVSGPDAIVRFNLGAGLIDADIANVLGVRSHTKAGTLTDSWLIKGMDGPLSDTRMLSSGVPDVEIVVPEPGALSLLSLAVVCLLARSRQSRR